MHSICWYYDVSALSEPERFESAMASLVWPERCARIRRLARKSDALLSLGAGLLLAHALRAAGARDLRLTEDAFGKPGLAQEQGIFFSLAHSGTLAVCAVSDAPVGADTEKPRRADLRVAARCFTPRENECLRQSDDPDALFVRLWTRKESYFKRTGEGLGADLAALSVLPGEEAPDAFFAETRVGAHAVCVCTEKAQDVVFIQWDPGAEYFDVCGPDGLPTGRIVSREQAHREGIAHRTSHVWVVREKDGRMQVLLQKRSRNKDAFPGMYDTSSAGHIPAGDEPLPSALRELHEELGIAAEPSHLAFLGNVRIRFDAEFHGKPFRDNEYSSVYLYREPVDEDALQLQESEVESVRWFDLSDVEVRLEKEKDVFCMEPASLALLSRSLKSGL